MLYTTASLAKEVGLQTQRVRDLVHQKLAKDFWQDNGPKKATTINPRAYSAIVAFFKQESPKAKWRNRLTGKLQTTAPHNWMTAVNTALLTVGIDAILDTPTASVAAPAKPSPIKTTISTDKIRCIMSQNDKARVVAVFDPAKNAVDFRAESFETTSDGTKVWIVNPSTDLSRRIEQAVLAVVTS